jgi:4-amino-4-deoxy-L-arabinose transferase-like glycosyltransferase
VALGVSLLLLFSWGNYAQFFNPDEGRYASASLEMAGKLAGSASDWIVPHLNGVPRLNKPPLVYWLEATSFKIFGPSEVAGRLPGMLAATGVALALWFWGRRAIGESTGRLAALVWLSSTFPFAFARIANTDILLASSIALATLGVWLAIDGGAPDWELPTSRDVRLGALLAGIGMALGILSKGPVGVFFPLATGFISIIATMRWRVLGDWRTWAALGGALALAVGIVLPWALAISQRVPGLLARFFFEENLSRFSGSINYHDSKPWYFYLPIMLAGCCRGAPSCWPGLPPRASASGARCDSGRCGRFWLWASFRLRAPSWFRTWCPPLRRCACSWASRSRAASSRRTRARQVLRARWPQVLGGARGAYGRPQCGSRLCFTWLFWRVRRSTSGARRACPARSGCLCLDC